MSHVLTPLRVVQKQDCSEATALARELGLELQAKRYEKPLAENAFTPLTPAELIVWRNYCPTTYAPGGGTNDRKLEEYAFDSVPIEVMRHWKAIKDNYSFDRYEVWTTERIPRAADPLLIGIIGTNLYLLARWGMESPEAMPLKAVAKAVAQRMWETRERRTEDYGFMLAKTRETGDLYFIDIDHEFKAACALADWKPTLRQQ